MKRYVLLILAALSLVACEKREPNPHYVPRRGPGQMEVLFGAVPGNDFTVEDALVPEAKVITVAIRIDGQLETLPHTPAYWQKEGETQIRIVNAQAARADEYIVALSFF